MLITLIPFKSVSWLNAFLPAALTYVEELLVHSSLGMLFVEFRGREFELKPLPETLILFSRPHTAKTNYGKTGVV
jgi:hypothetical protein